MIIANILIKQYQDVSKKTMSVIWSWSVLETSHLGSSAENSHSQNPVYPQHSECSFCKAKRNQEDVKFLH